MAEIEDETKIIPLEEIKNFKLDEKEFNDLNNKLDEDFIFETILYEDENKNKIKFKGTLKNGKYEGRGILYEYATKNGYFKNGKMDGFGRCRKENGKKLIFGYFKDDECIKGIIKYNNKKKYEYEFIPDKKSSIGIEYFANGNIKRKMEYDFNWDYTTAKKYSFGILYDDNNNIIYSGLLKDFKPKESDNIVIYNEYGNKMYFGGISNYLYNRKGVEYYK